MGFTKKQQQHVKMQLAKHQRPNMEREVDLGHGKKLKLLFMRGVFASDIMSSGLYLARFLDANEEIFRGKVALDMGCGAGTQGIIMAMGGAKKVDLADVNPKAVKNAEENVKSLNLKNARVMVSDLFDDIKRKYDVIVFNHPFFSGNPETFSGDPNKDPNLRKSMLAGKRLIHRFLGKAKNFLRDNGLIVMPYFHFAGAENNPANHASKYGLRIVKEHKFKSKKGLQQGDFSIYILS